MRDPVVQGIMPDVSNTTPPAPKKDPNQAPSSKTRENSPDDAPRSIAAAPEKSPIALYALGGVCVVLVFAIVVLWKQRAARDEKIVQTQNRAEQVQAEAGKSQTQIDEARAASARLQQKLDDTLTELNQNKTELTKARNAATELQAQLEKTRS